MHPSFRILLIDLPLLTTGCSSLFYIEAETEEALQDAAQRLLPGLHPHPRHRLADDQLPRGDISATIPTGSTEAQLTVRLFDVTATGGNPDLSGVEEATVALRLPGQVQSPRCSTYRRPPGQPATQRALRLRRRTLDLKS